MDLSGPHEGSPQPGARVGSSQAHYFLVITVKFADEKKEGEEQLPGEGQEVQDRGGAQEASQEEPKKPILYAAIMEKKSDTAKKLQALLAQIRSEFGSMPRELY